MDQSKVTDLAVDLAEKAGIHYIDGKTLGGDNYVTNGTFYSSSVEGNGVISSEEAYMGSQSLKIVGDGTNLYSRLSLYADSTQSLYIAAEDAQTYVIEYWVKAGAGRTETGAASVLTVGLWNYLDAAYVGVSWDLVQAQEVSESVWTKFSSEVTLHNGINRFLPIAYVLPAAPAGDVYYFDHITVRQSTDASNAIQIFKNTLTGIVDATDTQVDDWLLALATGGDLAQATDDLWQSFLDKLTKFTNATDSDLDNWLLSLVTGGRVPLSSIVDEEVNLLRDPGFASATTLASYGSSSTWVLDPSDVHGPTANSIHVDLAVDGAYYLYSEKIPVTAGQLIKAKAHVKWKDVTGGAWSTTQGLVIREIEAGGWVGPYIVSDTIDKADAIAADQTTDWQELSIEYEVPEGVEEIVLLCYATALTGNEFWFSDLSLVKAAGAGAPISWISGLGETLTAISEFIQGLGGALLGGFVDRDSPFWTLEDIFDEVTSWFLDTEDTAANVTNAQADIVAAQTGMAELSSASVSIVANRATRNQAWVCRYPVADVSYPESMNVSLGIFGDTGDASTGTAHTHDDGDLAASAGGNAVNQDASRGSYISISNTVIMTHVAMGIWVAAGTAPDAVYIEVFREASDGSLTRMSSDEVSGDLTTTAQMIEVEMSQVLICQAGERYLVRLRNESTNATYVYQQNVLRTGTMQEIGFYTGSDALTAQTSYTSGESTTAQGNTSRVPFSMLAAPSATGTDTAYLDDFNNREELGPSWLRESNGTANLLKLSSDSVAYDGTTNATELAMYIHPTSSDRMLTIAEFSNVYLNIVGAEIALFICANRELDQIVALVVEQTLGVSSIRIKSGDPYALTTRASVTGQLFPDTNYSLAYDPDTNIYTALKNGAAIGGGLTWEDTGDVITHGADHRYGGIMIERSGGTNAGRIDNWFLRDYATSV